MQLRNTTSSFGLPAVLIHWITALTVLFMFGLGVWMRTLDYYSPWYRAAPELHKSIGLLLVVLTLARVGWMLANPHPAPPPQSPKWERAGARLVHVLLYLLLFSVMVCGYLISTADGRPIPLFGLVDVPALPWAFENQEEVAGKLHRWLAYSLIGLVGAHALAALKHHFIDRDDTLRRMTFGPLRNP